MKIPQNTEQKYHISLSEINTLNNGDHKVLANSTKHVTKPFFKVIAMFTYSTTETITIKTYHRQN